MSKKISLVFVSFCLLYFTACNQVKTPDAHGPVPTENQLRWQEMEYYAFLHFSTNTFTDEEWGYGRDTDAQQRWRRACSI